MKIEKMDLEQKRAAYVEAYDAAITALVPDFDPKADKETASPWCLSDYSDAIQEQGLEMVARGYAEKRAPEIAKLIADDLENADGMPRIILFDGAHHIYDVNNCLDIFGRCENGLDFEAIKEAFNRAPKMMVFDAFKEMAQSFESNE